MNRTQVRGMSDAVRNFNGEMPRWQNGRYFSPGQGEWFALSDVNQRYGGIRWQIGLFHLDTGEWLNDGSCYSTRLATRESALRHAVADIIREARNLFRISDSLHMLLKIGEGEYKAVVCWALSLLGRARPVFVSHVSSHNTVEIMCPRQMDLI